MQRNFSSSIVKVSVKRNSMSLGLVVFEKLFTQMRMKTHKWIRTPQSDAIMSADYLLVICPYKLTHCAIWVLSCLVPLFMEERRNYLYLSAILWDSKGARSLSNLVECKVS